MSNGTELTPTSGNTWRKAREGITLTLPSGNVAMIRPVGMDHYLKWGRIPNFVLPTILRAFDEPGEHEFPRAESLEEKREWLKFLDDLARVSFISPRVVEGAAAEDDEINVDDIAYEDKRLLVEFLGRPAEVLASFRNFTLTSLESVPNGTTSESVTEPALQSEGMGK